MAIKGSLLKDFVHETQSMLSLDDGYALDAEDGEDSSKPHIHSLAPTQNSIQAAEQLAELHGDIYSNLKDNDSWSGYMPQQSPKQPGIRELTPSQRFHITTGLIDATAPRANVHEGLNYDDRGAVGFTPSAKWDAQFAPNTMKPTPAGTIQSSVPRVPIGGVGLKPNPPQSFPNSPHTYTPPF